MSQPATDGAVCAVTPIRVVGQTVSGSVGLIVAVFVGSAARAVPPLVSGAIQQELGWPDADVTSPIAISIAVSALAAPIVAIGLERVGFRALISASLVFLAASLALSSLVTSPWQLLLFWGVGVGLGGSLGASILGAVTGLRDHPGHCGTSFGLFSSAQFLGTTAGLLLASWAMDAVGWRVSLNLAGAVTLIAAFAAVRSLYSAETGGSPEREAALRRGSGNAFAGDAQFWVFGTIFFICGASTSGLINGRLGILCVGNGIGLPASAGVLAIIALGGVVGSAASGLLADRYPARMLLASYFTARAMALFWLPFTSLSFVGLAQFGAFYGLDAALTFPALLKLLSRHSNRHMIGKVMSWMVVAHIAGAAVTSAVVGIIGLANYAVSFTLVGFMCLLAVGLVQSCKE